MRQNPVYKKRQAKGIVLFNRGLRLCRKNGAVGKGVTGKQQTTSNRERDVMGHISVVGAGLAGCEAAWAAANAGAHVTLIEMKPHKYTAAHHSPGFAIVCSNRLRQKAGQRSRTAQTRAKTHGFGVGYAALSCEVAAGGALVVDRELFSKTVTQLIKSHKHIKNRTP